VPFSVAITLVIVVGTGMLDATGCVNDCLCTVIRPPEAAAEACSWPNTQSVAAPIPRFGSVWLDDVCRVPKLTSFRIVALIRPGSMSRSIARRPGSGAWRLIAGSVSARAVPPSRGTATAVTAEADRNARRVAPARPGTSLFSFPTSLTYSGGCQRDHYFWLLCPATMAIRKKAPDFRPSLTWVGHG
jgi:hypothetical protein